jgi:acylphosphatase
MATPYQRREVRYSGRVQGVGFRFRTIRVARHYEVAGYVRNLPDGDVELVAEGNRDQLDQFLAEIGELLGGYIRNTRSDTTAPTGEFTAFDVRY